MLATGFRTAPPVAQGAGRRTGTARSGSAAARLRRPGLYVVGQRFQHRRDSATIDGARHDAQDVVAAICADDSAALRALELR